MTTCGDSERLNNSLKVVVGGRGVWLALRRSAASVACLRAADIVGSEARRG